MIGVEGRMRPQKDCKERSEDGSCRLSDGCYGWYWERKDGGGMEQLNRKWNDNFVGLPEYPVKAAGGSVKIDTIHCVRSGFESKGVVDTHL